jgi:hypothetical protein
MTLRTLTLILCSTAAFAAGAFDGQYHGTLSPGGANAAGCSTGSNVLMTVNDGTLQYNHFQNGVVRTALAPDGSFTGKAESRYAGRSGAGSKTITLTGRITGTNIEAKVTVGTNCTYALSLHK